MEQSILQPIISSILTVGLAIGVNLWLIRLRRDERIRRAAQSQLEDDMLNRDQDSDNVGVSEGVNHIIEVFRDAPLVHYYITASGTNIIVHNRLNNLDARLELETINGLTYIKSSYKNPYFHFGTPYVLPKKTRGLDSIRDYNITTGNAFEICCLLFNGFTPLFFSFQSHSKYIDIIKYYIEYFNNIHSSNLSYGKQGIGNTQYKFVHYDNNLYLVDYKYMWGVYNGNIVPYGVIKGGVIQIIYNRITPIKLSCTGTISDEEEKIFSIFINSIKR